MPAEQRQVVVAIALGRLLPLYWYHVSVSDHSPPEVAVGAAPDDGQLLDDLRAAGFALPAGPAGH